MKAKTSKKNVKREYKTRPFKNDKDFTCPVHKIIVVEKKKFITDEETGLPRGAGRYMGCPKYSECHYYVSAFSNPPMVAIVE